jgi:hypothetical protein
MSLYGATHARFEGDQLTHLRVGLVDGGKPAWDGPMRDLKVIDVVDLITTGDSVYLIQQVDGLYPPGPKLLVAEHSDGVEYLVEDGEPEPGRSIADLPRF